MIAFCGSGRLGAGAGEPLVLQMHRCRAANWGPRGPGAGGRQWEMSARGTPGPGSEGPPEGPPALGAELRKPPREGHPALGAFSCGDGPAGRSVGAEVEATFRCKKTFTVK